MHPGSIDNPASGAGRVYAVLKERMRTGFNGGWVGGWDLSQIAQTTAVSTRISEIRLQLMADSGRRETVESEQRGRYWFYRLVETKGQLDMFRVSA